MRIVRIPADLPVWARVSDIVGLIEWALYDRREIPRRPRSFRMPTESSPGAEFLRNPLI